VVCRGFESGTRLQRHCQPSLRERSGGPAQRAAQSGWDVAHKNLSADAGPEVREWGGNKATTGHRIRP
jgi:hypothetical protein